MSDLHFVIVRKRPPAKAILHNTVTRGILISTTHRYNITSMTGAMRKALNRERTHVGRGAYTGRVKSILMSSRDKGVARMLVDDLQGYQSGTIHDEMKYVDVAAHACKILNASSQVVFVTPQQLQDDTAAIDNARRDGLSVMVVPEIDCCITLPKI